MRLDWAVDASSLSLIRINYSAAKTNFTLPKPTCRSSRVASERLNTTSLRRTVPSALQKVPSVTRKPTSGERKVPSVARNAASGSRKVPSASEKATSGSRKVASDERKAPSGAWMQGFHKFRSGREVRPTSATEWRGFWMVHGDGATSTTRGCDLRIHHRVRAADG